MPEQSYASHRRYHPMYHFVVVPILVVNVLVQAWFAWQFKRPITLWSVAVSIAIALLAWVVRDYATGLQDRVIRLEERLRIARVAPDLAERVDELTTRQLTALRFCPDPELPDLTRAVLAGELRGSDEIKRRIQTWRADHHRV